MGGAKPMYIGQVVVTIIGKCQSIFFSIIHNNILRYDGFKLFSLV